MKVGGAEYKISGIGPRTDAGRVGPRLTGCGSVQGGGSVQIMGRFEPVQVVI